MTPNKPEAPFLFYLSWMKARHLVIPLKIYPFDVIVSIAETNEVLERKLKKLKDVEEIIKWDDKQVAHCAKAECGTVIIRLRHPVKAPIDHGYLAHEVAHATHFVADHIGLELTMASCEAFAYLTQYITTEIYQRLK